MDVLLGGACLDRLLVCLLGVGRCLFGFILMLA